MRGDEKDEKVLAWFRGHHSLIRRCDALDLGLSPATIKWRDSAGVWVREHPSVYRHAASPRTDHQRLLGACWGAGAGAVASHRAAAWIWGLWWPSLTLEVTVPHCRRPTLAGVVVHRSIDVPSEERHERMGIPATNPLRTLIDLGAVVPPWAVESAVDRAVAQRLVTVPALATARDRISRQGVRGGGVLRIILEERGGQSDRFAPSVLESKAARLFRQAGLPDPQREVVVGEAGEYRLDFAWPEAMLAVEVHGWAFHSSLAGFQADVRRANAVVAEGWLRLQYTWSDITRRRHAVATEVARHYRAALARVL